MHSEQSPRLSLGHHANESGCLACCAHHVRTAGDLWAVPAKAMVSPSPLVRGRPPRALARPGHSRAGSRAACPSRAAVARNCARAWSRSPSASARRWTDSRCGHARGCLSRGCSGQTARPAPAGTARPTVGSHPTALRTLRRRQSFRAFADLGGDLVDGTRRQRPRAGRLDPGCDPPRGLAAKLPVKSAGESAWSLYTLRRYVQGTAPDPGTSATRSRRREGPELFREQRDSGQRNGNGLALKPDWSIRQRSLL
jgi:hypothetical protein